MIEFKPATAWRTRGAPPVQIPPEVSDALDKTYRDHNVGEFVPVEEGSEDTNALIRYMRIYAERRRGKKFDHQFFEDSQGRTGLRFQMRDPRPYRATTVPRTRR